MSASNTKCPYCARLPGERHEATCCESSRSMHFKAIIEKVRTGNMVWPGKNMMVKGNVTQPDGSVQQVKVWNPGVPMVKPPKPWTAGGLPSGRDAKGNDRRVLAKQFYVGFIQKIRSPRRLVHRVDK